MRRTDSWTFIFNPVADKGRAAAKEQLLERSVAAMRGASIMVSRFAGHATELAREAAGKSSTLVACGGDGTLHEVVNAVVGLPVRIGILPAGSANDFLKTIRPSERDFQSAIRSVASSSSRRVDLGLVDFGGGRERYFVNSLGIGFTGRIARQVKSASWLRGELSYAYALLSVLLGYAPLKMHIEIETPDGHIELDEAVFAFSVSNGAVEGGKFRIAPHADPADGLLDVCILRAIPKWRFPGYVLKYLRGSQIDDPRVLYCRATAVSVFMPDPDAMHMDGEVLGPVCGQLAISVSPQAIEMLCDS